MTPAIISITDDNGQLSGASQSHQSHPSSPCSLCFISVMYSYIINSVAYNVPCLCDNRKPSYNKSRPRSSPLIVPNPSKMISSISPHSYVIVASSFAHLVSGVTGKILERSCQGWWQGWCIRRQRYHCPWSQCHLYHRQDRLQQALLKGNTALL